MKLAAAAVVISITVGCHSATDAIAVSALGVAPIAVGAADLAAAKPGWDGFGDAFAGSLLISAGTAWIGGWLVGAAVIAHRNPHPEQARAFDAEARAAVQDGRCGDVPAILARARAFDAGAPEMHAAADVTMDPVVAPCVASLQRDEARERAWQLTKSAETAARNDGCLTVRAIDPQVRELDAELHATVFARDVAIARCLTAQP